MRDVSQREIVLPQTEPETEWVRGRALQKVSPTYSHARLQSLFAAALITWNESGERGRVGTEWRFRVTPPGCATRPLVPDVAYLSYDALSADAGASDVEVPSVAPTVAVEILSPDDRAIDVDDKIATYLAAGTMLVVVFDPHAKSVVLHDAMQTRALDASRILTHPALPSFALDLAVFFRRAAR